MEKDKNLYNNEEIERILSPKCDFHVSSNFKERVMKAAESELKQSSRMRNRWLISAVASVAVIVSVFTLLSIFIDSDATPKSHTVAYSAAERLENEQKMDNLKENQTKNKNNESASENLADIAKSNPISKVSIVKKKKKITEPLFAEGIGEHGRAEDYQHGVEEAIDSQEDDAYVFSPQVSSSEHSCPVGAMPMQTEEITGAMPLALQDDYVFNLVEYSRNDHLEYIENIRHHLEETALFIREVLSE